NGSDLAQVDAAAHQMARDDFHAFASELVVVALSAARIGKALKLDEGVRIALKHSGHVVQLPDTGVSDLGPAGLEVHDARLQEAIFVAVGNPLREARFGIARVL